MESYGLCTYEVICSVIDVFNTTGFLSFLLVCTCTQGCYLKPITIYLFYIYFHGLL